MTREQLEHLIRAASVIADDDTIVIIGSQAILGQFPDAPESMRVSVEADLFPLHHPERADVIEGSIGELSPFHETFGYYGARARQQKKQRSKKNKQQASRRVSSAQSDLPSGPFPSLPAAILDRFPLAPTSLPRALDHPAQGETIRPQCRYPFPSGRTSRAYPSTVGPAEPDCFPSTSMRYP